MGKQPNERRDSDLHARLAWLRLKPAKRRTSAIRAGSDVGGPAAATDESRTSSSSTSVFHSPHPSHLPDHLVKTDPQAVQEEAQTLNERLSPWVFQISQYKYSNMTKRLDDLLKPVEDAANAQMVATI